jgi:hypothetical protein
MCLAFWENGCIAPPFFEACLYTWKGEILHSSWSLEISIFSNCFLLKLENTRTFISTIGILFHEKVNSLKISQDLLV